MPLLARVGALPHVAGVVSPYSAAGRGSGVGEPDDRVRDGQLRPARERAGDRHRQAAAGAGRRRCTCPVLQVAAGGQVVENAEGFSVGPATEVGVLAALIILLLTFGSLAAAGMPLITAGLGLITGVALIGLATHVTNLSNISPDLALMIGLGVGIDYSLFIVTRFRENYLEFGDVERSIVEAMDTSGRAILLAGATVVIALLGMFATGVAFMYGLAIAAVLAVLLTLIASLTLLPALLSRFGPRLVRPRRTRKARLGRRQTPVATGNGDSPAVVSGANGAAVTAPPDSAWRRWSEIVQARPWPLAIVSLAVMVLLMVPVFAMRLDSSDAGNDPTSTSSRHAFDLLAQGFGAGFNGPLQLVAELNGRGNANALPALRAAVSATPDVVAVTQPRIAASGAIAVIQAYPDSAPQALATTNLVNHLRDVVLPALRASHRGDCAGGRVHGWRRSTSRTCSGASCRCSSRS